MWSPIAQGVLTGRYEPGAELPAGSRATDEKSGADLISSWLRDELPTRVQQLLPLAADAGLGPAVLAVAWVLQNQNVSSAIVSASRPEQVVDNAEAAGVRIEPETLAKIDDLLGPVVTTDPTRTRSPDLRA